MLFGSVAVQLAAVAGAVTATSGTPSVRILCSIPKLHSARSALQYTASQELSCHAVVECV